MREMPTVLTMGRVVFRQGSRAAMNAKTTVKGSSEAELRSAIVAFSHMLEAEPNDRLALETLSDAYERMGDVDKAAEHLVRLAEVVISEKDIRTADTLIARLQALPESPANLLAQGKLQKLLEQFNLDAAANTAALPRRSSDITREVSLAWDLLQAGELTHEDYSRLVQDLSERAAKGMDSPVSVLHCLQDRAFKDLDKIHGFLAKTSGKPFLSLSNFELQLDVAQLLPMDFAAQRGAIAFEKIRSDILVAILNPFDTELLDAVRQQTGKRCHFYLVSAADYDNTLAAYRKSLLPT